MPIKLRSNLGLYIRTGSFKNEGKICGPKGLVLTGSNKHKSFGKELLIKFLKSYTCSGSVILIYTKFSTYIKKDLNIPAKPRKC